MKILIYTLAVLLLLAGCAPGENSPKANAGLNSSSEEESLSPDAYAPTPAKDQAQDVLQSRPEQEPPSVPEDDAVESPSPQGPKIIKLTVPEGYTLARVGMLLEEHAVCTVDAFITAAQEGDYSDYPLAASIPRSSERCFDLEGYLFPDTYEIYSTDAPDAIIRKMLDHTEKKITAELRTKIAQSGYTVDQILTLASIIEKESFGHEIMPLVSSVLHNRLDMGMKLQCDVTITYVEGAIKPFISGDINRYNAYYNTFKCPALPSGPICNPGIAAIQAALAPATTAYIYFVTDQDKNYLFAETWEGHEENLVKAGIVAAPNS